MIIKCIKNPTAIALPILLAFTSAAQATDILLEAEDIYDRLETRYPNARNQCIPLAYLGEIKNAVSEEVETLIELWERQIDVIDDQAYQDATICIMPRDEIHSSRPLAHYNEELEVAVIAEDVSTGCKASFGLHEWHHRLQTIRGFDAWNTLNPFDSSIYSLDFEVDSYTMQVIGSYLLAHPEDGSEPYEGALNCLANELSETIAERFQPSLDALYQYVDDHKEAIEGNAMAAYLVSEAFYNNGSLTYIVQAPSIMLMTCRGRSCAEARSGKTDTLPEHYEEWIKPMYEIHYPESYRTKPDSPKP